MFLDGRKINLTEMMTFLVSLRDYQFCWYNVLMALLRKKWPYWSAPVSIVKIHVKFEQEKYYRELSYLGSSMFRGPVWARSTVQKWVLPTLGDLPAQLGYFKILCHGKICWVGVPILGSFECKFSAVVHWSFGNTGINHDQIIIDNMASRSEMWLQTSSLIVNFSTT